MDGVASMVAKLCRWAPVGSVSTVLARFDTQALQNPGISGTGYQQGDDKDRGQRARAHPQGGARACPQQCLDKVYPLEH